MELLQRKKNEPNLRTRPLLQFEVMHNIHYIKRNEYRVAKQGKRWKFKLMNAIDLSLAESNCKDNFIKNMNKLGYQVNWTDTRKYITYTTPEGYKCRD